MEIRTFEPRWLEGAKSALKDAFYRPESDPRYNEWEFADYVTRDPGFLPELCLVALEGEQVVGYVALTEARVGDSAGLALAPLGVRKDRQNRGVGTALVNEAIARAKGGSWPWIALLGGDYYRRFGFEKAAAGGLDVTDNAFDKEHLQILRLNENEPPRGRLVYCGAFYDDKGNLL